jgi:hypothetical protein
VTRPKNASAFGTGPLFGQAPPPLDGDARIRQAIATVSAKRLPLIVVDIQKGNPEVRDRAAVAAKLRDRTTAWLVENEKVPAGHVLVLERGDGVARIRVFAVSGAGE